ncbi:MAG: hypothetical protein ACYC7D_11305 [Nitrososphaerales archaeon]
MVEIWVPYGPVEVSFDIKQENLSQILEPHPTKLSQEDYEKRLDSVVAESLLLISSSPGTQKTLDSLLAKKKAITKIYYSRNTGALARRKAQEFGIQSEAFNSESLEDAGIVDGSPIRMASQVKAAPKLAILTSIHPDPLFGLTSASSDLISLVPELKSEAFKKSLDELPCAIDKSNASWYAVRALQTCPNVDTIEIIEKASGGLLNLFYGDPESVHSQAQDYFVKNNSVNFSSKVERIVFGCGGLESDRTLNDALARSFFNIATNVAQMNSGAKLCMLAECSQGLGSEALLRYVTGRFTPGAKLDNVQYFEGLETLLSFYRIQGSVELHLLSTLPNYFVERFEIKPLSAARDAPSSIVQLGSRSKILVVPDGTSTVFSESAVAN